MVARRKGNAGLQTGTAARQGATRTVSISVRARYRRSRNAGSDVPQFHRRVRPRNIFGRRKWAASLAELQAEERACEIALAEAQLALLAALSPLGEPFDPDEAPDSPSAGSTLPGKRIPPARLPARVPKVEGSGTTSRKRITPPATRRKPDPAHRPDPAARSNGSLASRNVIPFTTFVRTWPPRRLPRAPRRAATGWRCVRGCNPAG